MAELKKKWKVLSGWEGKDNKDYPSWFLNILGNRGLKTTKEIEAFLNPRYEDLAEPSKFLNMKKAVNRVQQAVTKKEKVVVWGDYDVDGICATALMYQALNKIGIQKREKYIPHREEEGYGLNDEGIKEIIKNNGNLIITVDCGITSKDLIDKYASEIDFIVCDHHEIDSKKMSKKAICLHPELVAKGQKSEPFCACGMAFFFAKGIQKEFSERFLPGSEKWLLDLVAMATICDVIPLTGQNRILTKWGLLVLSKTKRLGLLELAKIAGIAPTEINSYHVGFVLGPRLNAAGRLSHAKKALELLLTENQKEAGEYARELNRLNLERQEMCRRIFEEAREEIEQKKKENAVLLVSNKNWPRGVVGIIASRIAEEYARPTIIFENSGTEHHGSARSVDGFDITEALSLCESSLIKYGGHAKAAGLAVLDEKFEELESELLKIAGEKLAKEITGPTVKVDTKINLEDISEEAMERISSLEPFGYGNQTPILMIEKIIFKNTKRVGEKKNHLKFSIETDAGQLNGVWFNAEEGIGDGEHDICFALRHNYWNNRKSLELRAIDIQ